MKPINYKLRAFTDADIERACSLRGYKPPYDFFWTICRKVIPAMTNGGSLFSVRRFVSPVSGEFYYKWLLRVPVFDDSAETFTPIC